MTVRGWSRELRWPPNVPTGTHITADLAIRFEQAFESTADTWLRLQTAYDLAQARKPACDISASNARSVPRFCRTRLTCSSVQHLCAILLMDTPVHSRGFRYDRTSVPTADGLCNHAIHCRVRRSL